MISVQHRVAIRRPLYEVFAFVAEKENDPRWRPSVVEISRLSGDGTAGTTYHQVLKGPGGRPAPADFEITGYEPGKRLAFRATAGPVRPEGSFDFVEEGGVTHVTFTLEVALDGTKKLMTPVVSKAMRNEVQSLERLKQILEAG
ncbi:MAG: hypothetical protein E6G50_00785 [Actinobacteria bacterium]|nr:MAG: hypothetical protein E6G50_00785 [Actinomycetota bacterium]